MQTKYTKNLLIIAIALCISTLQAQNPQTSYTLNTNQTGAPKSYVARDYVTLQPGFSYSASSGNTFNAKIDAGLLFPPTDKTYKKPDGTFTTNPAEGAVVGAIPGQFAVSPTGAATYTIPIEVPAGINGMQPNISLVYNSQGGNGIAGWRWNIGGISSISRTGFNLYNDGKVGVPQLTTEDNLTLDGQRLILVAGSRLTDGAKYRTEIETYSDITYKTINDYVCFEVKTKEGIIMEFGSTDDSYIEAQNSTIPLTWLLTKVTDANGNYMTYSYGEDNANGEYWLDKIKYTCNDAAGVITGANEIDFIYTSDRADVQTTYNAGKKTTQSLLLKTIRTISNSQIQREFEMEYNTFDGFCNKLTKISESGTNGIKYNPTVIDWNKLNSTTTPAFGYTNKTVISSLDRSSLDKSMIFADFNNDGFVDMIRPLEDVLGDSYPYVGWEMYKSTNNGSNFTLSQTENINTYENPGNFPYFGQYRLFPCDVNGDGLTDIVEVRNSYYLQISNCNIDVLLSIDGQLVRQNLIFNINGGLTNDQYSFELGDFNADGSPELIAIITNQSTRVNKIEMYAIDIATNASRDPLCSTIIDEFSTYSQTTDVNGNGHPELFIQYGGRSKFYEYDALSNSFKVLNFTHNLSPAIFDYEFGDFNGDGKTDVLQYMSASDPKWSILISTGVDFVTISCPLTHKKYIRNNDTDIGDFYTIKDLNGDGKGDIVEVTKNSENLNLYYFNGSSFTNCTHIITGGAAGFYNNKTLPYYDINGDGKSDIVNTTLNSFSVISFTTPETEQTVSTITNGMQIKNTISYKLLNDTTVYSNGTSIAVKPVVKLCLPVQVVNQSITSTESLADTTKYNYKGLKLHTKGKGFLGFEEFIQDNVTQNRKSVFQFNHNTTYFNTYPTQQITTTSSGGNLISSTTFVPGVIALGLTSDHRYFPYTASQTTTDNLTGLSSTSETLSFDDWGNPQQVRVTTGGVVATKTMTYIKKGSWCDNKVSTMIDSKSVQNETTYTRNTNYTYDNNGNILTEVTDPENVNSVTTEYKNYDNFGHTLLAESTANGVKRSTSSSYTTSGRFLSSKTNVLGETTTYNWDETKGLLNSETNRFGTTSYTYNGFGTLVETRFPDGIRKAQVLQWASVGDNIGAKYYAYAETSGSAPVTVWYDNFGREIQKDTYGLNAKKISVSTEYYANGQLYRVSEPYFEEDAQTKTWEKTITYDSYGRPITYVTPMGSSSSAYEGKKTTVTTPERTTETVVNDAGQTITSKVNGKTVTYAYYASGLIKSTTPEGGQAITMEYDLQGKRTKLIDPDAGTIETKYNGFGDLTEEKQKIHNASTYITTTNNYALTGLLQSIVRNGETTSYTYDTNNRISTIEIAGKNKQTFTYDAFDRVVNVKEEIGSRVYNTGKVYDYFGRIKKEIYPSGFYTLNSYDGYGNLVEVKDNAARSIWKANAENARGQLTSINKGGKETTFGFDARGLPTSIVASGVENMSYSFDTKGNLEYRIDNINHQKEYFEYDGLNRLISWTPMNGKFGGENKTITYSEAGNITTKNDLGNFTMSYGGKRPDGSDIGPHALTSISGVPAGFPTADLNITYTDFKKIATLSEGTKYYVLTYGVDDQRRKSEYYANGVSQGTPTLTRYYLGNYEEEMNALGNVRKIHYLSGGALYIQNNGSDSLLYAYSDFQGSLIALTDVNGNVIEKYAYDPWGARRNPANWDEKDTRTKWITNRGYTGHEHIDQFGIINMNGRVYDPATAMFVSPDQALQSPEDWLNYNRYGYCLGNPFKYTDPSGNYYFWDDLAALFIGGVINWVSNGCQFNMQGLAYFGAGALAGEAMLYAPGAGISISGALGAANSIIGQGFNGSDKFNLGNVDITSVFAAGMTSMVTSYAGGTIGGSLHLDKVLGKITSPILKNVLGGQIAGTVTGGIFGGVSAGVSGQDILQGFWGGAKMGYITGTLGGIGNAAQYSLDHNVNIFSGKPNPVMEKPVVPEPLPIPKVELDVQEPNSTSPKVQDALNTLNELKNDGASIKINSMTDKQELNMTIKYNEQKLDMRIETHPIPIKYGGDGYTPIRHMNLDLSPKLRPGLPNNGHILLWRK